MDCDLRPGYNVSVWRMMTVDECMGDLQCLRSEVLGTINVLALCQAVSSLTKIVESVHMGDFPA